MCSKEALLAEAVASASLKKMSVLPAAGCRQSSPEILYRVQEPRSWWVLQGGPVRGGEAGAALGRTQPVPPAPTDPAQGTAEPRSHRGGASGEKRL